MKSRYELAEELTRLAPPGWDGRLVVAGSYATYPDKAEDIDLWLLGVGTAERIAYRRKLQKHWDAYKIPYVLQTKFNPRYAHSHFDVVASINNRFDPTPVVQFITTSCMTLEELLSQFDISTHCGGFYLNDPKNRVLGEGFTPINQTPRVLNFARAPLLTKDRLLTICERYGQRPHLEDIAKLDALIESECPF